MQTRDVARSELKGGGYLARPDGAGPHPGVVVIHEAYGLNDNIKDITRRFAEHGYAALAVDLFSDRNRAVCMARYMGGMLLGSVNRYGIDDLKAALTYLASDSTVDAKRLGAIGFCMGGGFAIAWACTDSRLKAIAPFYGANPRPLDVGQAAYALWSGPIPRKISLPVRDAPSKKPSTRTRSRTTSRSTPARATRFSTRRVRATTRLPPKTHGFGS